MTLKDLFGKKSAKPLSSVTLQNLRDDGESHKNVISKIDLQKKYFPNVDFSNPENFCFYGSAEKYYTDALNNIAEYYPYDGSEGERNEWKLQSSYLDNYVLENLYPRRVGHIKLGENYSRGSTNSSNFFNTTQTEYIYFHGGPNAGFDKTNSSLKKDFEKSNFHDAQSVRQNNLQFGGNTGFTTQFWYKKDSFSSANESHRQVLYDLWNRGTYGNNDYGRFVIEIQPGVAGKADNFVLQVSSGSAGADYVPIGVGLDLTSSAWQHFSFVVRNDGSNLNVQLYQNGELNQTVATGSSIQQVTGAILGHIGALTTPIYGTQGAAGYGKFSGSLDDFRFWKTWKTPREIGLNWKTSETGGTNTDEHLTSSLGVYYKFNEGIYDPTAVNGYDTKVLDYSGRTTNGVWRGMSTTSRVETSAFEEHGLTNKEFKDPIIYLTHPEVTSLKTRLIQSGSLYDAQNNSNFFNSLPSWIVNEDDGELSNLTQVMSSQFDEMYLQIQGMADIKEKQYLSSSLESNSFSQSMLENYGFHTSNLFSNTTLLEDIGNRTEKVVFEKSLKEVKDTIYQNLYNNIVYIFKSKGTEKSLRNVLRSVGINEDLIKINMYSNNSEYTIGEEYRNRSISKRYIDFFDPNRFSSTVFQMTSSTANDQVSYITSSAANFDNPITVQGDFIFPKIKDAAEVGYFAVPFTQSSVIGMNKSLTTVPGDTSWGQNNTDMTVYCVREDAESKNAYFRLTSSFLGINLTTGYYNEVYDNQRWNLSFQVKPKKFPYNSLVSGSATEYEVQFYGNNYELDYKNNHFSLSADVNTTKAKQLLKNDKRIFVGARRTNNTGSLLDQSSVLASSIRFWNTSLTSDELDRHAKDGEMFGADNSSTGYRIGDTDILKKDTLVLHWDLTNVSTSDSQGRFVIEDYSSGSAADFESYGSSVIANKKQHPAMGYGFPPSNSSVINREYLNVSRANLPEIVNGEHLVRVVQNDDALLGVEERPSSHYISIEKSIYSTISEEMINTFANISELNNLIGSPVDKYRVGYKDLEKARQNFFSKIENDPDVERYMEYYRWIDNSIIDLLKQFLPLSSDIVDSNIDVVESHVLERNKVEHKYPSFEERRISTNAKVKGVGELRYPWSRGHAPISQLESRNCQWWNERAEKTHTTISSSIATSRQQLFDAIRDSHLEVLNKSALFTTDGLVFVNENAKKMDYTKTETKIGTGAYLSIEATGVSLERNCDDILNPNEKIKYDFKVEKV